MKTERIIWIASYPRSGNTYLRTILRHAFGFLSTSIYPHDLGNNKELEEYVGHIELNFQDPDQIFKRMGIPFVKTHSTDNDQNPAIYVVRDGLKAFKSFYDFYDGKVPIKNLLQGKIANNLNLGTWGDHIRSWDPSRRPKTLLLRYEEMICELPKVLQEISEFLGVAIKSTHIPPRSRIAESDGRWVREKRDQKSPFNEEIVELFIDQNKDVLKEFGYL